MTRVLLVGKGAPERGGIPSFLQLILSSRLADEHQISLCNLTTGATPQGAQLTVSNVRRTLGDLVRVWREARGHDVVHLHSAAAPFVTMLRAGVLCLAARLAGCRVLLHAHGGRVQLWATSRFRRFLVRLVLGAAETVIAVSEEGRAALAAALGPDRVVLIANGVDLERFFAGPADRPANVPPRILYAGLLSPRKGVLDLLTASQQLRARGVDHDLWLVGGTPDEGPEGERAVRNAAQSTATLLGPQPYERMPDLYRDCDVFCLPSWWEAMPLSVLEAMASGVAVVATSVGDVPLLLDGGTAGSLVPPQDPPALAAALEGLLTDVDRRRRLAERGRHRAAGSFDAQATLAAIDALYRGDHPRLLSP
jgi:glycosyltransferase involved in cell wall biosynthesis